MTDPIHAAIEADRRIRAGSAVAGDEERMATRTELAAGLRSQRDRADERDHLAVHGDPDRRPQDDPDSRRFVLRIDAWVEEAELESHQVEGLLTAAIVTFGIDPRDFLVDIEEVLA